MDEEEEIGGEVDVERAERNGGSDVIGQKTVLRIYSVPKRSKRSTVGTLGTSL